MFLSLWTGHMMALRFWQAILQNLKPRQLFPSLLVAHNSHGLGWVWRQQFSHSFQFDVQQLAIQFLCSICHWRVFHFLPPLVVPMISKGRMIPAPGVNIVPSSDHRFQWSRVEELRALWYLLVRGSSTFIGDALKEASGQHTKSGIGHRALNFAYHGVQTERSIGVPGRVHPQL